MTTLTKYQVHLHVPASRTHGVAEFETMTEAYVYLIELLADLMHYLPNVKDCDWVDDDLVHILGWDDGILGMATVTTREETVH